jgi:hypothetical protein
VKRAAPPRSDRKSGANTQSGMHFRRRNLHAPHGEEDPLGSMSGDKVHARSTLPAASGIHTMRVELWNRMFMLCDDPCHRFSYFNGLLKNNNIKAKYIIKQL